MSVVDLKASRSIVRYDPAKNQFILTVSPFEIGAVMRLPMKRYLKKAGLWVAPATRLNCTQLLKIADKWQWDSGTREIAEATQVSAGADRAWPAWYKSAGPKPFKHQLEARRLAYSKDNYFLSMEQGTAKTKVAIDVVCAHQLHHKITHVVIVCPSSVCRTWEDEIRTHCPLPYEIGRAS